MEQYHQREKELIEKGYYIDKKGNLYNPKGEKITGYIANNGRRATGIRRADNTVAPIFFHRIVAYVKFGDAIYEEGIEVRHLDNNCLNNSWDNIDIGTDHDNKMDIPKEERQKRASNASMKYSNELAKQIREDHIKGLSYKNLMLKYGISSKGTLSFIINKRMYVK